MECLLLESTHHTHQLRYQIVVVVDDDDGVYLSLDLCFVAGEKLALTSGSAGDGLSL